MASQPNDSSQEGVVVARFELSDPTYPFVGLSDAENCRVAMQQMVPRGPGIYGEFFTVLGADPDRVLERAEETDRCDPRLLSRYDDGGLFEFVVDGFCPARELCERGAVPREVVGDDGCGQIVVDIPPSVDAPTLIEGFLESHRSAELREKCTRDRIAPLFTTQDLRRSVEARLTERQLDVLETAFDAGYYDSDRGTTGADLADRLGISPSTVSQHLNAAERKLIAILFEDRIPQA